MSKKDRVKRATTSVRVACSSIVFVLLLFVAVETGFFRAPEEGREASLYFGIFVAGIMTGFLILWIAELHDARKAAKNATGQTSNTSPPRAAPQ